MIGNDNQLPQILIVDDDSEVRSLLVAVLSDEYTRYTADSGGEALLLLETHLPDLLISDINMPGTSGIDSHKIFITAACGISVYPDNAATYARQRSAARAQKWRTRGSLSA